MPFANTKFGGRWTQEKNKKNTLVFAQACQKQCQQATLLTQSMQIHCSYSWELEVTQKTKDFPQVYQNLAQIILKTEPSYYGFYQMPSLLNISMGTCLLEADLGWYTSKGVGKVH